MPVYMHYEGIDGTVRRKKKKWFELVSVDFGPNREFALANSKNLQEFMAQVTEITVGRRSDALSQTLFKESVWGSGKRVVIEFVADGPGVTEKEPYMTIVLEETMIATYCHKGSGADGIPYETLAFSFTKLKVTTAAPDSQAAATGAAGSQGGYARSK